MQEFVYKGQWREGQQYKRNNLVTLGSIWHAGVDTQAKPGTNDDWVLMIPKPRDGKDGKDFTPSDRSLQRTVRAVRSR